MSDALVRRGPLDDFVYLQPPGLNIGLAPPTARLILRGAEGVAHVAGADFGLDLPRLPLTSARREARAALWLGPDEWLLIAEGEAAEPIRARLEAALAALPYSLVDVSARQIGLELAGFNAVRALNAGCPLDLTPSGFPLGAATRTLLGKAQIVLWRPEPNLYRIEVQRSFAEYVVRFLEEAARRAPPP